MGHGLFNLMSSGSSAVELAGSLRQGSRLMTPTMSQPKYAADLDQTSELPARPTPRVIVAIVNYCTAGLVQDCLQSLEPIVGSRPNTCVVIADNASPDGSGPQIVASIASNGWGGWARVLMLNTNGGFAFGNNAVIESAADDPPDYYWLLNSDTVVRPDALDQLLDFIGDRPEVGIAGSRLEFHDGTQQISTFRFPNIIGECAAVAPVGSLGQKLFSPWIVAEPVSLIEHECDWVSGASMLIRRQTVEDVGLMDQDYFLYYEETDFCRRSKSLGWQCWFVPTSRVVHLIGASTGVTGIRPGRPKRRPGYWFQSRRRYFTKNHGRLYAVAADAALLVATGLRRGVEILRGQESSIPEHFLGDLLRHSALFPASKQ